MSNTNLAHIKLGTMAGDYLANVQKMSIEQDKALQKHFQDMIDIEITELVTDGCQNIDYRRGRIGAMKEVLSLFKRR